MCCTVFPPCFFFGCLWPGRVMASVRFSYTRAVNILPGTIIRFASSWVGVCASLALSFLGLVKKKSCGKSSPWEWKCVSESC